MFVRLPFHAAEQWNKERISDSAERMRLSDVARSLWTAKGSPPLADQVNGCPFGFILHSEGLNPSKYKGKLSIVGSYVCRQNEHK
jgi:hypothetical protein